MRKKIKYTAQQLNDAADTYTWALRLIKAGLNSPELTRTKEQAGMAVLVMVEPFLLAYFRLLSGQRIALTRDLKAFLYLFVKRGTSEVDYNNIVNMLTTTMYAYFDGTERDSTAGDLSPYEGNDVYSWFLEILFADVLPNYRIAYTDSGQRINFFRYFQVRFHYSLSNRIKKMIGYECYRQEPSEHDPDNNFLLSVPDPNQLDLRLELDLTELEWQYLQQDMNPNPAGQSRGEQLLWEGILSKLQEYRKTLRVRDSTPCTA